MPLGDEQLGGDECGFSPVALLEDFQKIKALLIVGAVSIPIVENQKLDTGELVDKTWEAAIEASHGESVAAQRRDLLTNQYFLASRKSRRFLLVDVASIHCAIYKYFSMLNAQHAR